MDFEALQGAVSKALGAEPRAWVTIALLEALFFLAVAILVTEASRRRIGKKHHLTIKTSEEDATDELWLNSATMRALGLKWGDTVRIQGVGKKAYRKPRSARLRRRNGLADNYVELSPDLQVLLFKDRPDGPDFRYFAFAPGVRKGGFEEFWFNPNDQIRLQNRLGVALGLGLPLFQMVWTWVTT